MQEKRVLHVLPEVISGLLSEPDVSQGIAVHTGPAAVEPGADDQGALILRILLLDGVVDRHGAVKIFGIKPAGHVQDGMGDVIKPLQDVLVLSVIVIVAVFHVCIPCGNPVVEVVRVDVGYRPEVQEECIPVGCAVIEPSGAQLRGAGPDGRIAG